jgi:outer membrane protein assembly factor BamB
MKRCLWLFCGLLAVTVPLIGALEDVRMVEVTGEGAKYWPRWRGPSGQGLVPAGNYTDKWSPSTAVWSVKVPGSGNSSPIVWGDRIFLTTGYGQGE